MYHCISLSITLQPGTSNEDAQKIREHLLASTIAECNLRGQPNAIVGSSLESVDTHG